MVVLVSELPEIREACPCGASVCASGDWNEIRSHVGEWRARHETCRRPEPERTGGGTQLGFAVVPTMRPAGPTYKATTHPDVDA